LANRADAKIIFKKRPDLLN